MVTDHTSTKEQGKILLGWFTFLVIIKQKTIGHKTLYMYNNVLGETCSQVKPEFLLSP